jgi:hypothetical protein
VLAVIPNRKRITKKISVRFARRPFHDNMYGSTLLIRKDVPHGPFKFVFSPPAA